MHDLDDPGDPRRAHDGAERRANPGVAPASPAHPPPSPFWRAKLALDDALFLVASLASVATFWLDPGLRREVSTNRALRGRHRRERCFILGTSPSIGQQDLSRLAGEHTIAVNFFFHHPQAALIRPRYWVIQDKRLWRGGWNPSLIPAGTRYPGGMIDAIRAISPDVDLFLHAAGRHDASLRAALGDTPVHWLAGRSLFHRRFFGPTMADGPGARGNVMQTALTIADFLGFSEVYLLGLSLDGLARELSGRPVHFYDPPSACPSPRTLAELEFDHILTGYMIRGWRGLADHYARRGHPRVVNLTPDGHLDVFPRSTLDAVLGPHNP